MLTKAERVKVLDFGLAKMSDPDEPLRAYASPAGHIFCVFVA